MTLRATGIEQDGAVFMKSAEHSKVSTAWFHSSVESKNVDVTEVKSRRVLARGQGEFWEQKTGKSWLMSAKLESHKQGKILVVYYTIG